MDGDDMKEPKAVKEPKAPRTRNKGGATIAELLTFEELSQYFHLPTKLASEELGIGLVALKKACRRFGLLRWPYRKPRAAAQEAEQEDSSGTDTEEGCHELPASKRASQAEPADTSLAHHNTAALLHAASGSMQQHGSGSAATGFFSLQSSGNLGMPGTLDALGLQATSLNLVTGLQNSSAIPQLPLDSATAASLAAALQRQRQMQQQQQQQQQQRYAAVTMAAAMANASQLQAWQAQQHGQQAQQQQQVAMLPPLARLPTLPPQLQPQTQGPAAAPIVLPASVVDNPDALWLLARQLVEVPGLAGQLAATMAHVIQGKMPPNS